MARPATGTVVAKATARGTSYAIRFRAVGARQYVHLGNSVDGWTPERAHEELRFTLEQVERGLWQPPAREPASEPEPVRADPTFHEYASGWLHDRRSDGLAPRTLDDLEWSLTGHLLRYFAYVHVSAITTQHVDAYRRAKVAEAQRLREAIDAGQPVRDTAGRLVRPLSAASVNKTLQHLAAVLEQAVEDGLLASNPARGRRRRLKATRPRPVHLDGVDQIVAMLDAARELDADPLTQTSGRYPLVATLIFAGPRAGEAGEFDVRDLDLARARLMVGRSKTDAGMRTIDVLPVLRDVLAEHKAGHRGGLDDPLFPTATGSRRNKDNIARVLRPVVRHADELLADRGQHPLPAGVTPHKLRHTFASILVALGRDPVHAMSQLGHTDPAFTLRVYSHAMRFSEAERARLRALVEGEVLAPIGHPAPQTPQTPAPAAAVDRAETAL
jgi:integrase